MKVVVWNMQHQKGEQNWDVLREGDLAGADIYLLCEAVPAPERIKADGLRVIQHGSTKGIRCPCRGDGCTKRVYSTAVASPRPPEPLPYKPTRPGTWTAAQVALGEIAVTAIALYGLGDEDYSASVARSLSEISPLLEDDDYGEYLLLGGDLNILGGRIPREPDPPRVVLESIEAQGLVDCLQKTLPPDRYSDPRRRADMDNCRCGLATRCTHTRTFYDKRRPHIPYQDDYLFASRALSKKLDACFALHVGPDSPSDHAPIIATFA